MTKSCKDHQKSSLTTLTMTTLTTIQNKQAHPLWSEPDCIRFFLSRFPRVACHLCCQVALGEAEGAALGSGCKQLGKLGKSGEGEEKSYGGKDTAVDDS